MTGIAWLGIGTIVATFLGPLLAVAATRWIDARRARDHRRLEVFRALMRSRRTPLSPEFVGSLNLIEVEFYGCTDVITAWHSLLDHMNGPLPQQGSDQQRYGEQRERLKSALIFRIGARLGYDIPEIDINRGGYAPIGWVNTETEQQAVRRLLSDIESGKRTFPIEVKNLPSAPDARV